MDAASTGVTEEEDREQCIDEQDVFYRMVLFLAAITRDLFRRVLGADDTPFRPIMGKRGAIDAAADPATRDADSSSGVTTVTAPGP
jgi:hypothetical protein